MIILKANSIIITVSKGGNMHYMYNMLELLVICVKLLNCICTVRLVNSPLSFPLPRDLRQDAMGQCGLSVKQSIILEHLENVFTIIIIIIAKNIQLTAKDNLERYIFGVFLILVTCRVEN